MIHLTVAVPLGLDSLFFSFVQRLAAENGHHCADPQADGVDGEQQGEWIDAMSRSRQHHFVVGFRYPPRYWKRLLDKSATVAVLADGDGITRQVEHICRQEQGKRHATEPQQCLEGLGHGVDALLEMTEILLKERSSAYLVPPAYAFQQDPQAAFRRVQDFYQSNGVPILVSCWQAFSIEAQPFLSQISPASADLQKEIYQILSLEVADYARKEALDVIFPLQS